MKPESEISTKSKDILGSTSKDILGTTVRTFWVPPLYILKSIIKEYPINIYFGDAVK